MVQDVTCTCRGWSYARYATGARGEQHPACAACGKAIRPRGDDSARYFAARLERWCACVAPAYPARILRHQVWCPAFEEAK